ncbi:unnamed protein product [Rodentolepis nana]|uniref:BORCS6 domain-containing protein n=1 Tax=Rodentolepis nana TaxID=102285 RepID=A0A0R3T115_RODNA|nr:unnamed protein product [Rodentolepis nana]
MDSQSEPDDASDSLGILKHLNSLNEIEACARKLDAETTLLMANLQTGLQRISSLTLDCFGLYDSLVSQTCDEMDASIKSMYTMMAKCEEMVKAMSTIPQLHSSVLQVSKALSRLESNLSHS